MDDLVDGNMEWYAVHASAAILAIGYDPFDHTLGLQFRKGEVYHYQNVPQDVFVELIETHAPGKHLAAVRDRYTTLHIDRVDERYFHVTCDPDCQKQAPAAPRP